MAFKLALSKYFNLKFIQIYYQLQFIQDIWMFDQKVLYPSQFPVQEKNRKSTDVCCTILSAILPLTLFIVSFTMFNRNNLEKKFFNFTQDGKGTQCQNGQFVYSTDPNDFSKSVCVSTCPPGWYGNQGLCLPENDEKRAAFISNPSVSSPFDFSNFWQTLIWSGLLTLGLGLLWLTIAFCFPKFAPVLAHVLGALTLIALGVLALVLPDTFWGANLVLKIIFAVICFILAIILIAMLCWWANERKFQGIMLDYAKRFLTERPMTFFYIPVFLLLTAGLIALTLWQQSAFASGMGGNNNFWDFFNGGFWSVLNFLQLLWGLRFLRDAFNFCVSGAATDWYWYRPANTNCYTPYQRLLCRHWGSVAGGSFLNAFFTIPMLIIQLFTCHPQACCSGLGTMCYNSCSWLTCFFDLVRTDAYSYQNLSGIPFCNAARQAKKINERNPTYIGSHSPMNHYRFAAHAFLIPLALLLSWLILRVRVWNPTIWHWILLPIFIYSILNYFINLQADAAQGIQTSFLAERQLQNGNYKYMQRLLPSFRTPLEHIERRMHGEGDGYL